MIFGIMLPKTYKTGANALDKDDFYGYYTSWGASDVLLIDIDEENPAGAGNTLKYTVNVAESYFTLSFSSFAGSNDNLLTNYFYSPYNVTAYTNQIILPDAPATKTGTGLIFGANPNTMNISFYFGNQSVIDVDGFAGWVTINRYPITNLEAVSVSVGAEQTPNQNPFL